MPIHDPETAYRLADQVATAMGRANGSDLPLRTRFAVLATYYAELHAAYVALQKQRATESAVLNATFPAPDDCRCHESATPESVQEFVRTAWDSVPVGGGA